MHVSLRSDSVATMFFVPLLWCRVCCVSLICAERICCDR